MRPISNDEFTKHAIRTSADLLELNDKVDDIKRVQDDHTQRLGSIEGRLDNIESRLCSVEERLDAHIAVSEDHFRRADASFIEIRDLLRQLMLRVG